MKCIKCGDDYDFPQRITLTKIVMIEGDSENDIYDATLCDKCRGKLMIALQDFFKKFVEGV